MSTKRHSRRVAELGAGLRARKIIKLAIAHPEIEFQSVDILPAAYWHYLKQRRLHTKPANVNIRGKTDAIDFLQKQPDQSFFHIYSHFMLQHVNYQKRQKIFSELMRTLYPGGKFTTIEDLLFEKQLVLELEEAGFKVSVRRLTPEQLLNLGSDNSDMNARHSIRIRAEFISELERVPLQFKAEAAERGLSAALKACRNHVRQKLLKIEGGKSSKEARVAIDRIVSSVSDILGNTRPPFVLIYAKKLRKKE